MVVHNSLTEDPVIGGALITEMPDAFVIFLKPEDQLRTGDGPMFS